KRDGAVAAPQALRWSEDERDHVADAIGEGLTVLLRISLTKLARKLGDGAGLLRHDLAADIDDRCEVALAHPTSPGASAQESALAQAHEHRLHAEGVALCDQVDRVAHQRDANRGASLDQARQLCGLEA